MSLQYKIVKFCEIPFIGYLVMTQFKGNNSLHTGTILPKCEMHPCVMVIYIVKVSMNPIHLLVSYN